MKHVFWDSEPLSHACNPVSTPNAIGVRNWAASLIAAGHQIYIPEVIDYELRRELLRAGKTPSVSLLDTFKNSFIYVPIDTAAMRRAAQLWAQIRNNRLSTGDPKKLDIDVILAAQVLEYANVNGIPESELVIAPSNVAHLARFVSAETWGNITP